MTFEELLKRIAAKEDVTEEEVRDFCDSPDKRERIVARDAVFKALLRRALAAAADLGSEQDYSEPSTLSAIELLAGITDFDEPYLETLKQLALKAVREDQFENAMRYLQMTFNRAVLASNRRDDRSRRAMRYGHDGEVEAAIDTLASRFAPPPGRRTLDPPLHLALICSAIQDEDGPTVMTYKRAVHFRDAGFDVEVVSTETVSSTNSRFSLRLQELGIPFYQVVGETYAQKIQWLLDHFLARPANAISYAVSPHDVLGKLVGCIGVAPVQEYACFTLEPQVGKYDMVCHGISPKQEVQTRWPGRSRYFGFPIAMAEEIDAATPLPRAALGVPEDAVLLATFGRMTKCDKPEYLAAMARILEAEPNAWLLLAGRDNFGVVPSMEKHFRVHGVANRVRYLGPRQEDGPRLLKTVDIYCDTYPWPGGQSLGDAMQAGLPIVAMRAANDPDLDPTGCGPTTAVAEAVLDGVLELAGAADVGEYVRIARAYIGDPQLRARDGRRAREKAVRDCSVKRATIADGAAIRDLVISKSRSLV